MHFVDAKGLLTGSGGHYGMNIYRGCTHGCIYCDSRSLCYQFAHPFEDVEVKQNAPALLEGALRSKRRRAMIGTGSMSDPYMPCEEQLGLTRRCLEIILKYGFGAAIQTKSDRVLRDIDLLDAIHRAAKCVVQMTLTTWDADLCRIVEPNVCDTQRRVEALKALRARGIPTVVWLTPILPFINDTRENVLAILNACADAGVKGVLCFDMGLTLREGDREYFYAALEPRPADAAVPRLLRIPRHAPHPRRMLCLPARAAGKARADAHVRVKNVKWGRRISPCISLENDVYLL